jgi:hypothetical protein
MVLLQNQLLGSSHEKWTQLKWRPNNTFGSTQKLHITIFGNLKHKKKASKKASTKLLVSDSISQPLLSRPPFSNQSKDHWRNYTNCSTRCRWSHARNRFIAKWLIYIKLGGYAHRTPVREPFPWHPPVAGRGNAGMALLTVPALGCHRPLKRWFKTWRQKWATFMRPWGVSGHG